jgi:hypothetical protein
VSISNALLHRVASVIRRLSLPGGRRRAVAATSAVIALPAMVLAAPAHADHAATVKARTQRMADANLSSHQNGWYNPGEQVTLVCSKRGQPVKGFFSFNIPNGWDNLWYKTSDDSFVADVDIETGTLHDVTSDCTGDPNPPAPQGASKADAAVAKANSLVGTDAAGDHGCGAFVATAYGVPGIGYNTALEFRNALDHAGKIHNDMNFPKGALVFSESQWSVIDGQQDGHVDIARGDGTFVSGGVLPSYKGLAGAGHYVQVLPGWNPAEGATYLGWADAPW